MSAREGFLSDIKEIRRRARQHLSEGAVTQNYGGKVEDAVALLNHAVATEIVCILRYKFHAVCATGLASEAVKEEFAQHAKEEEEHLDLLAERINQLGGKPNLNPDGVGSRAASEYAEGENLVDMIKEDLVAERVAIETYREMLRYFGDRDPTTRVLLERILETTGTGFTTLPEHPVAGNHSRWVIETQQSLIVPDTAAETRWPPAMAELQQHGIVSFCSLPLTTARRRIGALGFGSRDPVTYTAADVDFLGEVAKLVAVAVDNALNFDGAQATQRQLSTERDHLRLLLEVTNALVSNLDLAELVAAISSSLERAIPHEFTALALYDKESDDLVVHAAAAKSSDGRRQVARRSPVGGSAAGDAFTARRTR